MTTDTFQQTIHIDRMKYVLNALRECAEPNGDLFSIEIKKLANYIKEDAGLSLVVRENILANIVPILESLEIFSVNNGFVFAKKHLFFLELEAWGLINS